jgi:hypothetical protein
MHYLEYYKENVNDVGNSLLPAFLSAGKMPFALVFRNSRRPLFEKHKERAA